eukprot:11957405-Prorocentrum_lima.AAC.1
MQATRRRSSMLFRLWQKHAATGAMEEDQTNRQAYREIVTHRTVQRRVAFTGTNGGNTPQRTFGVFSP